MEDYRIYYAQALYQACLYEEAMKVAVQIDNPEMAGQVCTLFRGHEFSDHDLIKPTLQMLKLQAAIKYGEEDLVGAKSLVDQCAPDDPDTDINRGS